MNCRLKLIKLLLMEYKKIEIEECTEKYIEVCTLFDSLFSSSRTLCGQMTKEMIDKLEIVMKITLLCWRNL